MKKITFFLGCLGLSFINNLSMAQYCVPNPGTSGCQFDDFIASVVFGSINNSGSGCSAAGYGDFTSQSTQLIQGSTQIAQVSIGPIGQGIGIFIDWNQDLDFDDAGEFYSNNNVTSSAENITITIPSNATLGTTRMRVGCEYYYAFPSNGGCSSTITNYGEYEDYTVVVIPTEPANHLNFDGVNDYVEVGNEFVFDFANTFTMETWIKVGTFNQAWQTILSKGGVGPRIGRFGNTDQITFGTGGGDDLSSTVFVNDGQWHHIAAVCNNGVKSLYIDGVFQGTQTVGTPLPLNDNTFRIGSQSNEYIPMRNFNGGIDEVRIWNVARTLDEIQRSKDCELSGNEAGLLAYYKFNNGSAGVFNTFVDTVMNSSTTSGLDGTLYNFALSGTSSNWMASSPIEINNTVPGIPTAFDQGFCPQGTIANLSATANGGMLTWYEDNTLLNAIDSTTELTDGVIFIAETNATGCTSPSLSVDVQIYDVTTENATQASCGSYTWSQTGLTYTTTGIYRDTLMYAAGCDSLIYVLDLTINSLPTPTATDNGDATLSASSSTSYQWINCATNIPIAGANQQNFAPTANGDYAVIATNATGCSDTSVCVTIDNLGAEEFNTLNVSIYPNPSNGEVSIKVPFAGIVLAIKDAQGREVWNGTLETNENISLSNLNNGVYFFVFDAGKQHSVQRVVKQ